MAARAYFAHFALLAVLMALFPSLAHAGTWVAFGPQTFVRGSGAPTQVTASFSVLNPNAVYVLQINNGGLNGEFARSTGVITLNGNRILGPLELNPLIPVLVWPIRLLANNQLGIQLQGVTGSGISLKVIGVDIGPPSISATISPAPNSAHWNNSNVTVSFTCSDKTSGVASCPSPVLLTNEGARQVVSGTVTDKAGNKATTSVTVNLDKTPPIVSGTINPPPDEFGWNTSNVTVSFGCSDQLSGIAFCSSPVALTMEGAGQLVTGTARDIAGNTATVQTTVNISTSFFSVRNYGGKCLDYGTPPDIRSAGTAVFLNDCAVSHPIRVEEINGKHEVILHAGTQVIGIHNPPAIAIGIALPPPQTQFALELQNPEDSSSQLYANQVFALDGDSIILAANRNLVSQVQNARGANYAPVVAGPRILADSELWDFNAIDGSDKDPTSGFVRVGYPGDPAPPLDKLLSFLPPYTDPHPPYLPLPGTVLKIAPGTVIDTSGLQPLQIPGGVTIRGDRRGTLFGPLLCKASGCDESNPPNAPGESMLEIRGDDVRITGLRLQGTSRTTDKGQPNSTGILAHDGVMGHGTPEQYVRSIVDHNDISDFTQNGVRVRGNDTLENDINCDLHDNPFIRPLNVFVARNFIHHNQMQDFGYGVETNWGGFPLVYGNTFVSNRHAIAAGYGSAHSGYRAWSNLVLSDIPLQRAAIDFYTHNFDMHGTDSDGFGGLGGDYVDILGNTFLSVLSNNRHNYELRAGPCHDTDFHLNATVETKDDALNYKTFSTQFYGRIDHINIADNPSQFEFPNPTDHLGAGDFDGDKNPDLFLATGTAWYYAPWGSADWRLLSAKSDLIDTLLFGDFDGDGRTDVVAINGSNLMVSWGGASDWEVLNSSLVGFPVVASISDLAVGNFVDDFAGDRRDDIFWADGTTWRVSSGGSGPFNQVNTSSFRVKDLRFGDFDGDGKTDVFGVVSNGVFDTWSYSKSAQGSWSDGFLQEALAPVDRLVVADFDGNGRADIATWAPPDMTFDDRIVSWDWRFSYDGLHNWTPHQIAPNEKCTLVFSLTFNQQNNWSHQVAGIARFSGNPGADVLVWNNNELCIVSGGTGDPQPWSRQDLR
ncbi:MAG: VCBS repeat-containing protein [Acidobacteriia bacterium]|nr:VCBS repeat-containing protein [Terriglobia bacterium]